MFRLLSWQLCKGGLEEADAKCTGVSSRLLEQAGGGARGRARGGKDPGLRKGTGEAGRCGGRCLSCGGCECRERTLQSEKQPGGRLWARRQVGT